jgi:hypothetical protein
VCSQIFVAAGKLIPPICVLRLKGEACQVGAPAEKECERSIRGGQRPCHSLKWLALGGDTKPGGNKSRRNH